MILRPYQGRAVSTLWNCPRGIVKIPAGGGKTLVAAAALDRWLSHFKRLNGSLPLVKWIAPTQEICGQAQLALSAFPSIAQRCRVEIACYAAIPNCAGAVLVILDECKHIASPEFRKCLEGCTGWRWGFDATPERADELAPDVYALIGPIVCTIEREELVSAGHLAEARVRFHSPNAPREFEQLIAAQAEPLIAHRLKFWRNTPPDEIRSRTIWTLCQEVGVFKNAKRNAAIVRLAREHAADSTLILVGSIEHGGELAREIPGSLVAHSKMGAKKRRMAMEQFRAGELRCMIGTSLLDEGADFPRASVLIRAGSGRSKSKSEQTTGRVLRPFTGKTHGLIHDFTDAGHFMLASQSKARRKVYESLGYEIDEQVSLFGGGQRIAVGSSQA